MRCNIEPVILFGCRGQPSNKMDGNQLIESIDQIYYRHEDSFNLNHITDRLPDSTNLTSDYLLDYKSQLERLLTVVTRKVSELILSHQPAYINELQRIADLQKSITESIRACSNGRRCLKFIKDGTKNELIIVNHYKKRETLTKLLNSLTTISELRKSVMETRKLIDVQEDFPRAIQMCQDRKTQLAPYDKYKCVNDLRSKLNDTLEIIGERMDTVLSKMFVSFNPETYLKLNAAYTMMNRGEIAVGQLSMHFNAYHNSSVEELKMFLENDLWEMLPVKSDFTLVHLKEFSFLRTSSESGNQTHKHMPQESKLTNDASEDLFHESVTTANHSEATLRRSSLHDHNSLALDRISLSSESDLDSELEKDFVDEDEPPPLMMTTRVDNCESAQASLVNSKAGSSLAPYRLTQNSGPVLTNSSLNVLRLAGRYIQMMTVLTPITYEILMKVYKLLDVYTIFVFRKFGPNNDKQVSDVIASLRESLISPTGVQSSTVEHASAALFGQQTFSKQQQDNKKTNKDFREIDTKKSVAIESLIFLVNQFWNLQEYLETLITAEQRIHLREQFSLSKQSIVPDFLKARAELQQSET